MSEKLNAIVLGGTGKSGREIVRQLCQRAEIENVKVIVRNGSIKPIDFWSNDQEDINLKKITQKAIDFDNLQNHQQDFKGNNLGFCALGTTRKVAGSAEAFRKVDVSYVTECAKLLLNGGVTHFSLVTATMSNPNSFFLYPSAKGELEENIKKMDFKRLSIFRPGFLFGRNDKSRPMESFLAAISPGFLGVDVAVLGKAMVHNAFNHCSKKCEVFENSEIKRVN